MGSTNGQGTQLQTPPSDPPIETPKAKPDAALLEEIQRVREENRSLKDKLQTLETVGAEKSRVGLEQLDKIEKLIADSQRAWDEKLERVAGAQAVKLQELEEKAWERDLGVAAKRIQVAEDAPPLRAKESYLPIVRSMIDRKPEAPPVSEQLRAMVAKFPDLFETPQQPEANIFGGGLPAPLRGLGLGNGDAIPTSRDQRLSRIPIVQEVGITAEMIAKEKAKLLREHRALLASGVLRLHEEEVDE